MAWESLLLGISVALTPANIFWCFVGVLLGTVVGILPGMGSPATVAMLLPLTTSMNPTTALIMMAGIFYGAKYGGSTTSILLNLPGESSSVVTCIDGYQMARQGRAGPALGIAAIASFIAGTVGIIGLMLVAPPLAQFALRFGPPEYFALMLIGLTLVVFLSESSLVKGLLSCVAGLLLSLVGTDLFTAESRFAFGQVELLDGIDVIVASVGIFAIGEILVNIESRLSATVLHVPKELRNLLPTLQDLKDSRFAFLNGSVIGFLAGTIPGGGATIASFLSYGIEKAVSRRREKFGTGVVEGVAAPEAANNSETGGALVPLLTLGIPSSNTTAILLAGLTVWGLRPGPLLIQENPELFWGLVASMYIGNVMLLILNLPLVPLFAQIMRLPVYVMYPLVAGISMVGVYSVANSIFDVWMLIGFGVLGYAMRKFGFPAAPLILGLVLGNRLELALRQSLMMSQGDVTIFFTRWLSALMLGAALVLLLMSIVMKLRMRRLSLGILVALAAASTVHAAQAPSFQPKRAVEVVVHTGPGGGSDLFARAIATMLRKENLLTQPMQIVNKPGGSGAVAMAYMATKKGDVHTIGFFTDVWVSTPLVQPEARFTLKDLTPVVLLIREPGAAVVRTDSPYTTMFQFLDAARKKPGQLRQAGGSVTSVDNLLRLLTQKASGASWSFISFPSGGERTAALLGGHADLMLTQLQETREQLRAGRLRIIATFAEQRLPSFPDIPTIKEQGINIPVLVQFRGVVAPPGVARDVTQYWEYLMRRLITTETWKKYVRDEGLEETFLDSTGLMKFWDDQTALIRRALSEGTALKVR